MNLYRLIIVAAIIIATSWAIKVYATTQSVTMTTYYPSAAGNYDNLKATTTLTLPCYDSANQVVTANMPNNSIWIDMGNSGC